MPISPKLLTVPGRPCTEVSVLSNVQTLSSGLQQTAGAAVSLQPAGTESAAAESTAEVNIEHLVLPRSYSFSLTHSLRNNIDRVDSIDG